MLMPSATECLYANSAAPVLRHTDCSSSGNVFRTSLSNADVDLSAKTSCGPPNSALATATRCCCPTDSSRALRVHALVDKRNSPSRRAAVCRQEPLRAVARVRRVLANRVLSPVAQWWSGILRTVRMRPMHRAISVIVTGDAPRCSRRSTRGNGARGSLDSKGTRPGTRAIGSQSAGARIRRCLHRWFCPWTSRRL